MDAGRLVLHTVGHGTLEQPALTALLCSGGIESVVDVRTAPGSRRLPHVGRAEMERWLPAAGIAYRWEPDLGGFRRAEPQSVNLGLRNQSFRGYADHMRGPAFQHALQGVLTESARRPTAVMCAESLWWRCHRRLIADVFVLCAGGEVLHVMHDGRVEPHRVTDGARREGERLRYDAVD